MDMFMKGAVSLAGFCEGVTVVLSLFQLHDSRLERRVAYGHKQGPE